MVIILILELGIVFCFILNDFRRLFLYFGWLNYWQIFPLLPRNGLIVLSVLLFGLIYALLDLFHLFIVSLLRFLSFIVLLYGLNSISTSDTSVLMKIFALWIIRKLVFRGLLYSLLFDRLSWPEVISSHRPWLCPFIDFIFLRRLIEDFRVGRIIEYLLVFSIVFAFPFLFLFLPYSKCLSATDLHGPYFISRQILKQFDDFLLNSNSILVDLLSDQTKSITSLRFYPITVAIHRC